MNFLERIDAIILSFFTKISHKFQRLTGRTNFFLANICLTVLAMWTVLNFLNYFFPILTSKGNSFVLLITVLYIFWISSDKNKLKKAEEAVFDSDGASSKTRFTFYSTPFVRIFMLVLAIFSLNYIFETVTGITPSKTAKIFEIVNDSLPIDFTCYYYFTQVVPMPPGKSKVRQWLESFGKVLVPIPIKNKN